MICRVEYPFDLKAHAITFLAYASRRAGGMFLIRRRLFLIVLSY